LGEKSKLRRKFLTIRKSLSKQYVSDNSRLIAQRVLQSEEYKNAGTIHCYVSITENKEVHTHDLIRQCLEDGKKVVVPKMADHQKLRHIFLHSMDDLVPNHWNVPEPKTDDEANLKELDLILVPMVAGDRFKNRVGYGKGYYDRFLSQCDSKKMGLLFSCLLNDQKIPVDPYDVPMDIIITETERFD